MMRSLRVPALAAAVIGYFLGANALRAPINRTVPFLFQLPDGYTDDAQGYRLKMAVPPSLYGRGNAPAPTNGSVSLELLADGGAAGAAYTVAASLFTTPGVPSDDDFASHCGSLDQMLPAGWEFDPDIGDGEWSQIYATYSPVAAATHYNECWLAVRRTGNTSAL